MTRDATDTAAADVCAEPAEGDILSSDARRHWQRARRHAVALFSASDLMRRHSIGVMCAIDKALGVTYNDNDEDDKANIAP